MTRLRRWARWAATAAAVLLLFWIAASLGGWSPQVHRLTTSVHGPLVADYRADSPQRLAPLSPDITADASRDQASRGRPSPGPSPSAPGGGPSPSASGSAPPPSPTIPLPSLPTQPPLPTATPTLPTPVPTPSLPTLPPLP